MYPVGPNPSRFPATLLAVLAFATPAVAQHQQHQSHQRLVATPDNDIWLTTAVGIEYQIDQQWSFHLESQLQIDRDITRLRGLEVRPGLEYAFSPHWAAAAGYVQYQRYPAPLRTLRGPFQDILHRNQFGKISFAGRLRNEELFFENTALLVRTRLLAGIRIPIGESPWEFAFSDEVFINLKVDGTGREAGLHQNRTYVGFGRPVSEHLKMSAGYELDTYEAHGMYRNVHQIRIGFAYRLN
jgi:hypothetical protein